MGSIDLDYFVHAANILLLGAYSHGGFSSNGALSR